MIRIVAGAIAAVLLFVFVLTGLVALGAATSLRPKPRDLAPAGATAGRRVSVVLPPYRQRADPLVRAAVAPIGGETVPDAIAQLQTTETR
ncbi:hypothetical protein [Pinisolibacter sp.]|uniref:hypothetical protein n=1 Tax=Pinisolibacter sp. TaxID=2172024 RepID=UPI002FDE4911